MSFAELEGEVRLLMAQNKLEEVIAQLRDYFKDGSELDEIILQSAAYHSIKEKSRTGQVDALEVELTLNKLRSNVLQLLRSKREYLKYKAQTFGSEASATVVHEEAIKVFFSVGSPHNDEQQAYIDAIVAYFAENGIQLETLKHWNDEDPILPILEELKASNGCFVLALERFYIVEGCAKRNSEQETKIKDMSFTSPWLHIEAAIARSLDLPLIIFKDQALNNDGLIHDDKQEWGIVRIRQGHLEEIKEYPVKHFILSWINQVKTYHKYKHGI